MEAFAAVVLLAVLTEWLAERFLGPWVKGYWMVLGATVIGVALCVMFSVDGFALLGLPAPIGSPWTGEVITGLVVGAGSDAVHSIFFKKDGRVV